jgi:hypothetical protein
MKILSGPSTKKAGPAGSRPWDPVKKREETWERILPAENMQQIEVFTNYLVVGVTKNNELKVYDLPPARRWVDLAKNVQVAALGGEKPALWVLGVDGNVYWHREFLSGVIEPIETLESGGFCRALRW